MKLKKKNNVSRETERKVNNMKVLKIEEEKIYEKEIENTLESLQNEVEGYIEIVHLGSNYVIICNEEGRIKKLPYTLSIDFGNFNCEALYGNLILCKVNKRGNFISLKQSEIDFLMSLYWFRFHRVLSIWNY